MPREPAFAEIGFVDEVRQHFVIDLDLADGVARDFFGGRGHRGDFLSVPLDFRAGVGDHVDGRHAVASFPPRWYRCEVTLGVRVRAGQVGAVQQILQASDRKCIWRGRAAFCGPSRRFRRLPDDLRLSIGGQL